MSDTKNNAIDSAIAHKPSPGEQFYEKFKITPELETIADKLIKHYPAEHPQSAILPILHEIQKRFGYICGDSIIWTAEKTKSTPAHVLGVVTFYPGIRQTCPGKFHIRVCRTLACAMSGSEELVKNICKKLGMDFKELGHNTPMLVSPCGQWSVEFVECLANCGGAPNVLVNDDLHEKIKPDMVDELISDYEK